MFTNKYFVRTAIPDDFDSIRKLMYWPGVSYFGSPRRLRQFNKNDLAYFTQRYTTHRIIAKETAESERIIGYAEFCIYPKISAIPQDCWIYWMKHHFCVDEPITEMNIMFFDHFIYLQSYNPKLVHNVLKEMFQRELKIRYCAVVQMPDWQRYETDPMPDYYLLEPWAKIYYPLCYSAISCKNTQRIHIIERHQIVNKMRYRKAYPEDNDDIVEIVDYYRPDIRQQLGDYYIAEELLKDKEQTKDSKLICTDIDNETVGFIWLNRNVDILKCVQYYDLDMYDNLIRFKPTRPFKTQKVEVISCIKKTEAKLFTHDIIRDTILESRCENKHDKASEFTLDSQRNVRVHSEDGEIRTSNESFYFREEFFKKVYKINEKLRTESHYSIFLDKALHFFYNMPKTQSPEGEEYVSPTAKSNVFALQMLVLSPHHDIRRALRYLVASFSAFPKREYCIFSMPAKERPSKFLTEVLKYFVRIAPRPNCPLKDYFYLAHRSTLFGELCMYPVEYDDIWFIESLMMQSDKNLNQFDEDDSFDNHCKKVPKKERSHWLTESEFVYTILKHVIKQDHVSDYLFFTIRCGDSTKPRENNVIVGFVIVTKFTKSRLLTRHFVIPAGYDPMIDTTRGEILVLKLLPFYRFLADLLLRELARRTGFYNMVYLQPTRYPFKPYTNDLVKFMQPLEPKRIKQIYKFNSEMDHTASKLVEKLSPINVVSDHFAFYEANLRPLKYFGSDLEIVVLGFGPMVKAFLRAMIFDWNQINSENPQLFCCVPQFRKLMIVVPPGVAEADYETDFFCPKCKNQHRCWVNYWNSCAYVRDAICRMDLRHYVGFISGSVTCINKEEKVLILDNNCQYRYDYLFIMNDTQYGVPKDPITEQHIPPNYMHVNSRLDKFIVYHIVDQIKNQPPDSKEIRIVIYGNDIATYEFIEFLIKHDIQPSIITLVQPHCVETTELISKFNVPNIDKKLGFIFEEMVEDLGINLIYDAIFIEWECYPSDMNIRSVTFADVNGNRTVLKCELFISFWWRYIDPDFLTVIKESRIQTYNDCIVVDDDFRTSDPSIFASGKFIVNRKLYTNHQYIYVSEKEAAEKLVKIFAKYCDTDSPQENLEEPKTDGDDGNASSQEDVCRDTSVDDEERGERDDGELAYHAKYSEPCYFQAQLPFGYKIVKICVPKRYLANHLSNDYERCMITNHDGTFCRLRLNQHHIIEDITLVSLEEWDYCYDYLQFFCGKHESLINNLRPRYLSKEIESFPQFFEEPWSELLMHEHFPDLQESNRQEMLQLAKAMDDGRSSEADVLKQTSNMQKIASQMEDALISFLRKYRKSFQNEFALPEDFVKPSWQ